MLFCVLSVVLFGLSSAKGATLPVNTCKRDSDDYSACLKHAVEEAWPQIVKGLPEFDFPSLDPMFYKYGSAAVDSGEIHLKAAMSNVTARGLSKINFNDVRAHFVDDNFRLEVDTLVPKIYVRGIVNLNGTLNVFRLGDEAPYNVTAEDVTTTWVLTGRVVNDIWVVERSHVLPSFRKFKTYFEGFFQGDKALNNLLLDFLNEFWPALFRVMMPVAADTWDPWLTDLVNRLFSKVSFSQLFP